MPRGIDHLVLTAQDLDAQAQLYLRLGFTIGARNRHEWGTLNHIVQFPACFLELIATEPGFEKPAPQLPVANFAGFLADYLARREGLAMLALESHDAEADHAEFAARGIVKGKTLSFERKGRSPSSSEVHLAFTLAFAASPALPDAGFFVSQQHFPQNFWNPAFHDHSSTVTGISAVVMIANRPEEHAEFLTGFAGVAGWVDIAGGIAIDTGRGRIEVMRPLAFVEHYGPAALPSDLAGPAFAAIVFRCRDATAARAALRAGAIPHDERVGRLIVPASAAFGVALVLAGAES
jgi:Glyoxalase-like domain